MCTTTLVQQTHLCRARRRRSTTAVRILPSLSSLASRRRPCASPAPGTGTGTGAACTLPEPRHTRPSPRAGRILILYRHLGRHIADFPSHPIPFHPVSFHPGRDLRHSCPPRSGLINPGRRIPIRIPTKRSITSNRFG